MGIRKTDAARLADALADNRRLRDRLGKLERAAHDAERWKAQATRWKEQADSAAESYRLLTVFVKAEQREAQRLAKHCRTLLAKRPKRKAA